MGKGKGEIMNAMDWAQRAGEWNDHAGNEGPRLTGYSFEDRAFIRPLQATDIVAWTFFQRAQRRTANRPLHWAAKEVQTALAKFPVLTMTYTRNELAQWALQEQNALYTIWKGQAQPAK
jgi:hypothetical protein